jgi:H3 lysine-79-specific histone-lysine N-methyltransferase
MVQTMHKIIEHYLPGSEQSRLDNETTGLPQRLSRAINKKSEAQVTAVMDEWNAEMTRLRKDGTIAQTLDKVESINSEWAERIINQTFSRTVSLNLKYLHQYEAGTDNVYGELLPKFVSQILRDVRVSSDQVFVDLGSGVGNVVLQAALEAGCESWGCEMMEKYCEVADLQKKEFEARCRLWGLSHGSINLEKGDFLVNSNILEVLKRADVILVNNQVFTPKTNDNLTALFLELKEGAKIVSLRSFVPHGHKISVRNSSSVLNLLRVEQKEYFSKCVSWTDQGGNYYISTKDSTAIAKFHEKSRGR